MCPEEELVHRILAQAVDDYAELREKKREELCGRCGSRYSVKEIERFLKSQWCATLLDMTGCSIQGADILHKAKEMYR